MEENILSITSKHKQERKDLQSKIQCLKKSIPRGDKKKKREICEEVSRLERQLTMQQADELALIVPLQNVATEISGDFTERENGVNRISRAQKRRIKKSLQEKERVERIACLKEENLLSGNVLEMNAINKSLRELSLQIYDIPADGNCLYCAINHQLQVTGQNNISITKLRKLTADFMRQNRIEFMPFMYAEIEESVTDGDYNKYCDEVEKTKLWGGQLELRALSNILSCPIRVIQANGPPTVQGEHFSGPKLTITYHRHLYRLGEHYNSTEILVLSKNEV